MRKLEAWTPDDEHEVPRGRFLYVRFDVTSEFHTGPFCGPFTQVDIRDGRMIGTKPVTEKEELIALLEGGGWRVHNRSEPVYHRFSVVPS